MAPLRSGRMVRRFVSWSVACLGRRRPIAHFSADMRTYMELGVDFSNFCNASDVPFAFACAFGNTRTSCEVTQTMSIRRTGTQISCSNRVVYCLHRVCERIPSESASQFQQTELVGKPLLRTAGYGHECRISQVQIVIPVFLFCQNP